MDCVGQTLEVDDTSRGLHLGFARAEKVPPHLARLELRPPRHKGSLRWLSLEWKGLLEWWFTAIVRFIAKDKKARLSEVGF